MASRNGNYYQTTFSQYPTNLEEYSVLVLNMFKNFEHRYSIEVLIRERERKSQFFENNFGVCFGNRLTILVDPKINDMFVPLYRIPCSVGNLLPNQQQ